MAAVPGGRVHKEPEEEAQVRPSDWTPGLPAIGERVPHSLHRGVIAVPPSGHGAPQSLLRGSEAAMGLVPHCCR